MFMEISAVINQGVEVSDLLFNEKKKIGSNNSSQRE